MDFYIIKERSTKRGTVEVYPDFQVTRSKDLMVRGRGFYAVWDEAAGLWSTDEYDVRRLVDDDLRAYKEKIASRTEGNIQLKLMGDFGSNTWLLPLHQLQQLAANHHGIGMLRHGACAGCIANAKTHAHGNVHMLTDAG